MITNSFHGTVFSVIYKKQFYTIPHTTRGDRTKEFLAAVGLRDRMTFDSKSFCADVIAYEEVENKLRLLRKSSERYLEAIIQNDTGYKHEKDVKVQEKEAFQEYYQLYMDKNGFPLLTKQYALCCGCGLCAAVCPKNAISMQVNKEGFSSPVIDYNKCIKCYKCLSVCDFKRGLY